jgi:hypothetical protein
MIPLDEQKSLEKYPLPEQKLTKQEGDNLLPSRIYKLDRQAENIQKTFALNREARQALLDRAVERKIGEDNEAVIIVKEKNLPREINIPLLKEKFPTMHKRAVDMEIQNAKEAAQKKIDAIDEAGTTIHIGTLQALKMDEEKIDSACYPHKITRTYEVVSKALPLPKGVKRLTEE